MGFLSPGSKIRIENPSTQRRVMFWVRRRRGTKVRVPVTAWPEIAAWQMGLTPALEAGKHGLTRPVRPSTDANRRLTDAPQASAPQLKE